MMRRDVAAGAAFWLFVAAVMVLLAGQARAADGETRGAEAAVPAQATESNVVWGTFRGKLLFSDVMIAPASAFASDASRATSLRRIARTTIEGRAGFWRLHAQAFLDPPPAGGKVRLRAIDTSEPGQKHEIRVFEIDVQPGQRDLPLADLVLTEAMGFVAGHRYEILLERGGDVAPGTVGAPGARNEGKRDVHAKGVITLR